MTEAGFILVDGVERPRLNSEGNPIAKTDAALRNFWRWFEDSNVVDAEGRPLVVYRGEHGESDGIVHSRTGSITFGSLNAANLYAMQPNHHGDKPVAPRVIPAMLQITNPIIDNRDDPFMDMTVLVDALGMDRARLVALRYADKIEYTGNWQERLGAEFDSVEQLLDQAPDLIHELYLDAFVVLDDIEIVGWLAEEGYDGAVHLGNGETACEEEYRVFDVSQIRSAIGATLDSVNSHYDCRNDPSLAVVRAENKILCQLADFFKVPVVVVRMAEESRFKFNGASFADLIWLNERTTLPIHTVFGHELLHHMKRDQLELYDGLADALGPLLANDPRYARAREVAGKSAAIVREELIADLVGARFHEPEFWGLIARHHPPLFRRLADYINESGAISEDDEVPDDVFLEGGAMNC